MYNTYMFLVNGINDTAVINVNNRTNNIDGDLFRSTGKMFKRNFITDANHVHQIRIHTVRYSCCNGSDIITIITNIQHILNKVSNNTIDLHFLGFLYR